MNHNHSGGFWLEDQVVLARHFLEQALFGLRDFFFILLEALFDIGFAMDHQPPLHAPRATPLRRE